MSAPRVLLVDLSRRASPGRPTGPRFTRDAICGLLDELAGRLAARQVAARIELVGGAALAVRYYDRPGPVDIDAVIEPARPVLEVAAEMATERDLRDGWLSNQAQVFLPPGDPEDPPDLVVQHRCATVRVVAARTLLAMKLRAARPAKDTDDIAVLLRVCGVRTLDMARELLDSCYAGRYRLSARAERLIAAASGMYSIKTAGGGVVLLEPVGPPRLVCLP